MIGKFLLHSKRRVIDIHDLVKFCISRRVNQKKFVVFGPGRTGSTLFISICESHSRIKCDGELLEYRRAFGRILPAARARKVFPSLYGFKLKHFHLSIQGIEDESDFVNKLYSDGWSFVFLHRGKIGKQAISLQLARARNIWHVKNQENLAYVDIDPHETLRLAGEMLKSHEIYKGLLKDIPYFEVSYEDHLINENARKVIFAEFAEFLGVENEFDVESLMKKTSVSDGKSFVRNIEEVKSLLTEKNFEL
ncbi:MAG: hypothetical protein P1U65_04490 [Minwuia sp.]|nr:hypothetical protein [Minwuia sp.]